MGQRVSAGVGALVDQASFEPQDPLVSRDPLEYPGYADALASAAERSGADDSVIAGPATIDGREIELVWFNFAFIGGSVGEVAGERVARAFERAAKRGVPLVMRTATGGSRMQEGMRSLVQMPKMAAARLGFTRSHQPFICILGDPSTGGVLASVAGSADITVAESGATVAFAGPRVAERFLGRPRDPATHTAQAAFKNGLVDMVLPSEQVRDYVARALKTLASDEPETIEPPQQPTDRGIGAWEAVTATRSPDRHRAPDLTVAISEASVQLRGDRAGGQDPAIVTSIERIAGRRAVVLAMDRKFVPGPPAYRKARRCLDIAARLDLPVVTIVDTRGADPSEASESAGLPWEISATFTAMLEVPVPTLCIVAGEGGSGGALALATTDVLVAYEDSIFSVIGPELAAEILWRDASREREAAELLRLTGADLMRLGIADALVAAPLDGSSLRRTVAYHLDHLGHRKGSPEELLRQRRDRWRRSDFGN